MLPVVLQSLLFQITKNPHNLPSLFWSNRQWLNSDRDDANNAQKASMIRQSRPLAPFSDDVLYWLVGTPNARKLPRRKVVLDSRGRS